MSVERVISSDKTSEPLVLQSDLHMLVATGGKERTEAEYRALLAAASFELTRIIPVLAPYNIIEAVRTEGDAAQAINHVRHSLARRPLISVMTVF